MVQSPPAPGRRTAGPALARMVRALLALGVTALVPAACFSGHGTSDGGGVACAGFDSPGPGTGATFTIAGTVAYEDRAQNAGGFTGATPSLPVREATVEVVRCSDGAVLGSDVTTDAGAFSVDISSTGAIGVYVRALAEVDNTDRPIAVKDTHGSVYAVAGSAFDERFPPALALLATESEGIGPPFNILDNALTSLRWVEAHLGLGGGLQPLTLKWEADTTDFTAFLPGSLTIEILDQPNAPSPDTDGYDDMVIRHETGHFVAEQISKDDSPGGLHFLGDTDEDARLAWSEGWANFFGGAVADNPNYVDTFTPTPGGGALNFSLEDLSAGDTPPGVGGATAELPVAAILWDALDGTGGDATDTDGDGLVLGAAPILTAVTDLKTLPAPVEFGAFWNALRTGGLSPTEVATFQSVALAKEGIDLVEDDGTDDVPAGATDLGTPPAGDVANLAWDATAGSGPDVDHFKVTLTGGTSYTVSTADLGDGADTKIEVLDAAGDPLSPAVVNDNWQGGSVFYTSCDSFITPPCPANGLPELLASEVTFTPSGTGIYLIRVTRSPVPPPSAGLFGVYTLGIDTP